MTSEERATLKKLDLDLRKRIVTDTPTVGAIGRIGHVGGWTVIVFVGGEMLLSQRDEFMTGGYIDSSFAGDLYRAGFISKEEYHAVHEIQVLEKHESEMRYVVERSLREDRELFLSLVEELKEDSK